MTEKFAVPAIAGSEGETCLACDSGAKCARIAWSMPLLAMVLLYFGLRYPILNVFNMIVVAFGAMGWTRTLLHTRLYGNCGFGRHLAVGAVLNATVLVLVGIYFFTGLDPLHIRL